MLDDIIEAEYGNIAGIIVEKGGKRVYEGGFNGCDADTDVHVYSVTKSVVSMLIGIAVDMGYIKSVKQRVIDFFPDYTPKRGEKTMQQVTLENLLTMTAPYKYKSAPYTKYFTSESWVKTSLDLLGGRGRIGEYRYTPLIGLDIMTGILASATGRAVLDFAYERLFKPLGVSVGGSVVFGSKEEQFAWVKSKSASGWVADPCGVNTAGWGLALSAEKMLALGRLYLNGGLHNGERLVSSEWIAQSTSEHSRWDERRYGYLWWLIDEKERSFAALGDGGNAIYVNPARELVVAIASVFKATAKDRIELIKEHIEPLF